MTYARHLIRSCLVSVVEACGATSGSVFLPLWGASGARAVLVHTEADPAAPELQDAERAWEFARGQRPAGTADGGHVVPSEDTDAALIPVPFATGLTHQLPQRPPKSGERSRRASDLRQQPVTGWLALRFAATAAANASASLAGPAVGTSVLALASRLASLYLRLHGSQADPLTGLPGRSTLRTELRVELAQARADGAPYSLVLFNPDDFALVNTVHGRRAGDQMLREIVLRAHSLLRQTDVLYRYGAAIFAIGLKNTGPDAASIVADKLRAGLRGTPYVGGQVSRTFSAGVATLQPDDGTVHEPFEFMNRAELALRAAQRMGHGRVAVWRPGAIDAERVDRLKGAYTGDPDRDYRNMALLWDTVQLLAGDGTEAVDLASRITEQWLHSLSASLVVLFEVGDAGLAFKHGVRRIGVEDWAEVSQDALLTEHGAATQAAAATRAPVWRTDALKRKASVPHTVVCAVPLLVRKVLVGVLLFSGTSHQLRVDRSDLPLLKSLSGSLAAALERARAAEHTRRREDTDRRRLESELHDLRTAARRTTLVHVSAPMKDLVVAGYRVADTDATVLIMGESGTGKEMLAQTVHQMSRRRDRPFVIVDCGAIPATKVEGELFGYERGTYADAPSRTPGRLAQADGGTLLLDEIGALPLDVQSKLLRFVQEKQFTPVGSIAPRRVDVRLLATTSRDLQRDVDRGRFRADLYHALSVVSLRIPPLRQRPEDIVELAHHFAEVFAAKYHKPVPAMGQAFEDALLRYPWPGNVRELRNRLMRAVIGSAGEALTVKSMALPPSAPQVHHDTLSAAVQPDGGRPGGADASSGEPGDASGRDVPPDADEGPSAWVDLRRALDRVLIRLATGSEQPPPPLGRWLAHDLVLAAFEASGQVARRAAALLGVPESTFTGRLKRAQAEGPDALRPPEWAPVRRALSGVVHSAQPDGEDVFVEVESCLLERMEARLPPTEGASSEGVGPAPAARRRITLANVS